MNDSRLLDLYKVLSFDEKKEFIESIFLNNPNTGNDVISLYRYIDDCFSQESYELLIEKKIVHRHVFPNKEYSETRLNKLMSKLHGLIEDFIIYKANNSETQRFLSLAKFYKERNLKNRFESVIGQLNKIQENYGVRDRIYYLNDFLIKNEICGKDNFFDAQKDSILKVAELIESLDKFYVLLKLEYVSILLHENNIINIEQNIQNQTILKSILEHINDGDFESTPLILLYKKALEVITNKSTSYPEFIKFYNLLDQYKTQIPSNARKDFFGYARSFCSLEYNKGNNQYLYILYEILEHQLEEGEYYHNGRITANVLMNLIGTMLRLNLYDRALQCIEEHRYNVISENESEEIYFFNIANYLFHVGAYKQVLDNNFHFINFENIYYALAQRRLEIKLYYEQREEDLLFARLEAFKIWLHRKGKETLPQLAFDVNNGFIDILRQIIAPKTLGNKERIEKLIEKLEENRAFAEREWLLEKLEKMK